MNIGWTGAATALALLLGVAIGGDAAAADLLSGNVSVTGDYPTDTTIIPGYGPFSGPTVAGINECCGYTFSFTANTISYFNPYVGFYSGTGTDFNGWVLQFSGVPKITSVTNDPTSQMDPISISFTDNTVELNFSGQFRPSASTSVFDVTFAAGVPEPGTWAMMLVGFGGLGAATRMRRKLAATTA